MKTIQTPWADWIIREPLDSGSYGTVYRACHREDPELQSAIKVIEIPRDPAHTEALRKQGLSEERIRREYEAVLEDYSAEIRQLYRCKGTSHIMDIEDFRAVPHTDRPGGTLFIRMELLKSLPVYLSDKHLSEEEIAAIGVDICEALEICHANGILHRDIKPENIFVNDRLKTGVLYKLGDFGSAVAPEAARDDLRGTPSYIAPETVNSHVCTERSDLYSLGLTLYQLVNGNRLPFLPARQFCSHEEKNIALKTRLSGAPLPDPAEASPAFWAVLKKACAFQPENRYASAAEMKAALLGVLHPQVSKQRPEKPSVSPSARGKQLLILLLCLLCVTLGGLLLRERLRSTGQQTPLSATPVPMIPVVEKEPAP